MSEVTLTKDDWDLIKCGLKELYTNEAYELLNKIKDLEADNLKFKEELYLGTLYWHYVELFPSLGMTKELDEDFFKDKELLVTDKYEKYNGVVYYGRLRGHNIYIKLDDHPGSSGYDCCGYIRLTYSDDKEFIE